MSSPEATAFRGEKSGMKAVDTCLRRYDMRKNNLIGRFKALGSCLRRYDMRKEILIERF